MPKNILVKNGRLVLSSGIFETDLLIEEGKVSAIGKGLNSQAEDVIDASGKLIFPGVMDEHVHMREPGLTYKDDFTNGTMAAAAGGVTTVLEMPNTMPPVDDVRKLLDKARLLEPKAYVDFGLYGVIHDANADRFEEIVEAGAIGFKIFMGPTTGNIPSPDDGAILNVLRKSAELGVTLAFHAENFALVKYFTEKVKATGRTDPAAHSESRPGICEEEAMQRLVLFSKRTGGRVHIVHMSAKEGVELLRLARREGLNVTGETNPQYLLLSVKDYKKYGTLIKINPPVRNKEDQDALWRAINDGTISALGSDHAPHAAEEKIGDVWRASAGFIGVQTLFPLMLDSALRGKLELNRLPALLSEGPAKLFNLYPRKGSLNVGSDGDLVIVDPIAETEIKEEDLYAKYRISPFIGWRLKGRIEYTILRGEVIAKKGKVIEGPKGRWMKQQRPTELS